MHVNKRPVAEALDQMVKGTDVVYEIQGSNIILTVRSQQTDGPKVVSGKVTDNKGDKRFPEPDYRIGYLD